MSSEVATYSITGSVANLDSTRSRGSLNTLASSVLITAVTFAALPSVSEGDTSTRANGGAFYEQSNSSTRFDVASLRKLLSLPEGKCIKQSTNITASKLLQTCFSYGFYPVHISPSVVGGIGFTYLWPEREVYVEVDNYQNLAVSVTNLSNLDDEPEVYVFPADEESVEQIVIILQGIK